MISLFQSYEKNLKYTMTYCYFIHVIINLNKNMEDDYQSITFAHFFASFLVVVFIWGSLWVGNFGIGMMRNSNNLGINFSNQIANTSTVSTEVTVTNQENLAPASPTVTSVPVVSNPEQTLTILI